MIVVIIVIIVIIGIIGRPAPQAHALSLIAVNNIYY